MNNRAHLRKLIRQRRQALSNAEQQQASQLLLQQLSVHTKIQQAQHIAIYLANDGELNPELFIQWCWQQNKHVYLPVIHPFSKGHLLFLHYTPQTVMVKNHYGISEPKLDVRHLCQVQQLDLLCTPLVAFDIKGARLGMGGGFYDRTLEKWYKQYLAKVQNPVKNTPLHSLYPIGIAHDCQLVDKIPLEQWDIPLPEIITPTQHYFPR